MSQIGLILILNSNLKYDKEDKKHEFEEIISGSHYRYTFQLITVFSSIVFLISAVLTCLHTPDSVKNYNYNFFLFKLAKLKTDNRFRSV